MIIYTETIESPVGQLFAGVNDTGLFLLDFPVRRQGLEIMLQRIAKRYNAVFEPERHPLHVVLHAQLTAYFEGSLQQFDLPLQLSGTPFQERVWHELLTIPYGRTRSYSQQAQQLGDIKAIRAVAKANGDNCMSIIIPCHRIIGADGSMTGYAGGVASKKWLLAHEQKNSGQLSQAGLF